MFNYNRTFLKRDMKGNESAGGSDITNTISNDDITLTPEQSAELDSNKVEITKETQQKLGALDESIMDKINNGLDNISNKASSVYRDLIEAYEEAYDYIFSSDDEVEKEINKVPVIVIVKDIKKELRKSTSKINLEEIELKSLDSELNKLKKDFSIQKNNLVKVADESSLIEKQYNEATDKVEKVKLFSRLNVLKSRVRNIDSSIKDIFKKLGEAKNSISNSKQKIIQLKEERALLEVGTSKTAETDISVESSKQKKPLKMTKTLKEKKAPEMTEAEKKVEVLRKDRVNKLIKRYRKGNYKNDNEMNGLVKNLYNKNINVSRKTTQLEIDNFERAMDAVDHIINEKTKEQQVAEINPIDKVKKQKTVEVKKVSPDFEKYLNKEFNKLKDSSFSPNSRKNYKVPHTGGDNSMTNNIGIGTKKREMTNDEIKMYNTYVDKWNKVRGLAQFAPNPEPSLWDKASDFFSSNEEGSKKVEKRGHFTRFLVPIGTIHPGGKLENRMDITRRNNKGENISLTNAQIIAENKRNGYEGDTIDKQIKSYNEQKGKKDTGEIDIKQKDSIEKTTVLSQDIKDKILKKIGLSSLTKDNIGKKRTPKTIKNGKNRLTPEGGEARNYNKSEQDFYKKAVAIYNEVVKGNINGNPLTIKNVKSKIDEIK